MNKIDKEKLRKREWYEANKDRLKKDRVAKKPNFDVNESKVNQNRKDKQPYKYSLLSFYTSVCGASSIILINFTAQVLGRNLIGYTCSILLEIGIVTLSVLKPAKKVEYWTIKTLFVIFTSISLLILHAGSTGSANKLISLKMKLAEEAIATSEDMPKTHTSKRLDALKIAKKELTPLSSKASPDPGIWSKLSNLAIRIVLTIENLLFAHLIRRELVKK